MTHNYLSLLLNNRRKIAAGCLFIGFCAMFAQLLLDISRGDT
jgi:hypothetical protein